MKAGSDPRELSMSIQFSGISSGLPVNDIIEKLLAVEHRPIDLLMQRKDKVTAEKSQYSFISSRATALRAALQKLTDAKLGSAFDVFAGKKATSSQSGSITASATNDAQIGSFTVDVLRLATSTRAASTTGVAQATTGASVLNTISDGAITNGSFTVFVDNVAHSISVDKDTDDINDIFTRIGSVIGGGITSSVGPDGKLSMTYGDTHTIRFGATGDTSNAAQVLSLATGAEGAPSGGTKTFTAQYGTSVIDKQGKLSDNTVSFATAVTEGTFTIGKAEFEIDADTTLDSLLNQINNSAEAGVQASYNMTTNKIELISKKTGEQAITLGASTDSSNFLVASGLIQDAGGGNFNSLSSQTIGLNAQIQINGGSTLESFSNSVDSSVTGMAGVTLSLLAPTTSSSTIQIDQDKDQLKSAVSDFITKFNSLISQIDDQTKKDAMLNGESSLVRFRNQLRTQISDGVDTALGLTKYTTLSQVGISTGAVKASPGDGAPSATFSLDESKLFAALAADPDEVKKLFVGDGTTGGIINKLEEAVKSSLDPEFGLFSSRDKSANDQISALNKAITRGENRLLTREKLLRAQFSAMETLVAQLQQQQSSVASLGLR